MTFACARTLPPTAPKSPRRLDRTIPIKVSITDGLDIGMDSGSPVDFTYQPPFAFTGKIDHVTIELKLEQARAA